MAKGYDGLLRGMPEATLLVGLYRVGPAHARLVGRYLYRFERPSEFPTKVGPREASNESLAVPLPRGTRLAMLVLAVEEDSGRGLQSLFAALEPGETAWFDRAHEGLLSAEVKSASSWPLSPESRALAREMLRTSLPKLPEREWNRETARDLRRFLDQRLEAHIEKRLKTLRVLEHF